MNVDCEYFFEFSHQQTHTQTHTPQDTIVLEAHMRVS